jgi:type IV secretion system protein VirB5
MTETMWSPPPTKDYKAARQQFMELYGSLAVMNTYLKIALLAMSLVSAGLVFANVKIIEHYRNFRPLVIRVTDTGKTEAVSYTALESRPQPAEMKYFLIQFVQLHYARVRATVREDYAHSLYFLDGRLADSIMEKSKKDKLIETFLTDRSDEIDVRVTGVSIEDLRNAPYRAKVEFEKVYYSSPDHTERRREKYTGNFVFTFRDDVSNDIIPVNPLGFTITYFREDQAF